MSKSLTPLDRPLTKQQQRIVDHIMFTGETIQKTSESLNLDKRNIYRTLGLPHVKKELHSRTMAHMGILAPYAARAQAELLNADSDTVRANVAENILDRHLGKPITRSQVAIGGSINVNIDLS